MPEGVTVITCQDDLVAALKRRRAELRMTCLELDHKAGLQDGYVSHLERPHSRHGRGSLRLNPMAASWIEALGLRLVLIQV